MVIHFWREKKFLLSNLRFEQKSCLLISALGKVKKRTARSQTRLVGGFLWPQYGRRAWEEFTEEEKL